MADSFESLMAAVLQSPRDDAPRLRLADWLEARSDPRGEFIRVQLELARLGQDADETEPLARRERELLARHEMDWVGPLAEWLSDCKFRRGFIEEATVEAGTFLARGEELFAAAPVEFLRVHEAGAANEDLAACPHLARVRRLHIGLDDGDSAPLGDQGLVALARSPHLNGLESLTFSMEQIGGEGLVALA
jgi:uncharacterized protein (TIGR02996 family)